MSIVFKIVEHNPINHSQTSSCTYYLRKDTWDDFGYRTTFRAYFSNSQAEVVELGRVKIAKTDMSSPNEDSPVVTIDLSAPIFDSLSTNYFSIGETVEYYEALNKLEAFDRESILISLNDAAYCNEIFRKIKSFDVVKTSFFRRHNEHSIGQLNRISRGGAKLTDYEFAFKRLKDNNEPELTFNFTVKKLSLPPSNVHAIIGRNGAGKTTVFKDMFNSLIDHQSSLSSFTFKDDAVFVNTVFVSFSAFDKFDSFSLIKDKNDMAYLGLKNHDGTTKSDSELTNEFVSYYKSCRARKAVLWKYIINTLNSDPIFKEHDLSTKMISTLEDTDYGEMTGAQEEELSKFFDNLSSGHKVILLSLTALVDLTEEKTLVLIDEPESHLHPPLLSAYIRAISELMSNRNGVAIIATHSPVVLQEIPAACVQILNCSGQSRKVTKPTSETFGENVGTLTRDIFKLEIAKSGFHQIIQDVASQAIDFESLIDDFGNQLGSEAKAIAMVYMYQKASKE